MKNKVMKNKKVWKIAIPVAIGGVLFGVMVINNAGRTKEAAAEAMKVEAVTVERGDVSETVETNGTVVSGEQKTIFSPVNAQVETAEFQTGDLVKEGRKLVTFDVGELEAQNQKAELTVRANQLGYQDSVNKSNEAAVKQAQARAQADALQAQVNAKKQELENLQAEIAGEARSQMEEQERKREELEARLKSLQKELKKAQKALEKSETEYEKAQMEQQTAQVNFEAAAAAWQWPGARTRPNWTPPLPRPMRSWLRQRELMKPARSQSAI